MLRKQQLLGALLWETQKAVGADGWMLQPEDQLPLVLAAVLSRAPIKDLRRCKTSSSHSVGLRVSDNEVGISLV